jgi:hypothetical protein
MDVLGTWVRRHESGCTGAVMSSRRSADVDRARARLGYSLLVCTIALLLLACRRETVRPPEQFSAALQGLIVRTRAYAEQRRQIAAQLPPLKAGADAAEIKAHEDALIEALRAARAAARQGDVIDAEAANELRRALREVPRRDLPDERPTASLRVNAVYPEGELLSTMPASLLQRLPPLPEGLQFRIVNRSLVLLDWESRLIIDFVPDALPS